MTPRSYLWRGSTVALLLIALLGGVLFQPVNGVGAAPANGPLKLTGQAGKTIDGGGAIWKGTLSKRGLWLVRCRNCTVRNLTLTDWEQGVRLEDCQDIAFDRVIIKRCGLQGFLTVGCRRVSLSNCTSVGNAVRDPRNKGHDFYAGEFGNSSSRDLKLTSCTFGPCGNRNQFPFQINAETAALPTCAVLLQDCKVQGPKAMNMLGVAEKQGSTLKTGFILDRCQISGRVNLAKPAGRGWPSFGIRKGGSMSGQLNLIGGSKLTVER